MAALIEAFFHAPSFTFSYVVADPDSGAAAVIDPVLDYEPRSARAGTDSADRLIRHVREHALKLEWILETHAHADHLSAAQHLKRQLGGRVAIGEGIREVQATFRSLFDLPQAEVDVSQFDRLLRDGDRLALGELELVVLHTPGHTSDSVSYRIEGAVFVGDTLFASDYGTARTDFPGGDARDLYRSIQRLFALPPDTFIYLCHDYPPDDRDPECRSTVAEQRERNVHVRAGVSESEFVRMRRERDTSLDLPELIIPAVQVNIRAGHLPAAHDNGVAYLRLPLNVFGRARTPEPDRG